MKYNKLYENWQRFNEDADIDKAEAAWYANVERTLRKWVNRDELEDEEEETREDIMDQLQDPKFMENMILKLSQEGIRNLKTVLEYEIKSYKEEGFPSGGLEDSLNTLEHKLAINEDHTENPVDDDGDELDPRHVPDIWDATKDDKDFYDLIGTHPDGYPLRTKIREVVINTLEHKLAINEEHKMKLHKINNKRNERLFKRLTESCGCAVTEETIDEGPFDAIKDKVGDLADKVTGKKRGSAVGGKGFNAHGESQEDGYDQKIFAAWTAKSNAIADVYNKLVDQNGKVFKLLMKKSLDFNSVKPFDLEKLFIDEMKKDVRLRRVMKAWAKGEDDRAFNILSKQQLKKLNSVLNSGKHGFSGDKAIGTVFYRSLEEVLDSLMEFVGDLDYQDYLGNKFLRGRLRTTVKRMLSPKAGRSGERAWKEFTAGAHFDSDGTRNSLRDAANAAAFAAETIAETVDEERSNGEEASINERNVRTNEKNNVKYNKLYENWNRHLESDKDEKPMEMGREVEPGLEDNSATHDEIEDAHGEELKKALGNLSEDSESDTAMVNLLSQISQKLDGLEDIDTSIDYLIGALSGETALSAKMKQSTLGRFADASPQLAELIKKYQE